MAGDDEGPDIPEPPPPRLGVERFAARSDWSPYESSSQPSGHRLSDSEDSPSGRKRTPVGFIVAGLGVALVAYFVVRRKR
jgi:hypothetical protein